MLCLLRCVQFFIEVKEGSVLSTLEHLLLGAIVYRAEAQRFLIR